MEIVNPTLQMRKTGLREVSTLAEVSKLVEIKVRIANIHKALHYMLGAMLAIYLLLTYLSS